MLQSGVDTALAGGLLEPGRGSGVGANDLVLREPGLEILTPPAPRGALGGQIAQRACADALVLLPRIDPAGAQGLLELRERHPDGAAGENGAPRRQEAVERERLLVVDPGDDDRGIARAAPPLTLVAGGEHRSRQRWISPARIHTS